MKLLNQNVSVYEILLTISKFLSRAEYTSFHFHQQCIKETISFGYFFNGPQLGHICLELHILKFYLIFVKILLFCSSVCVLMVY